MILSNEKIFRGTKNGSHNHHKLRHQHCFSALLRIPVFLYSCTYFYKNGIEERVDFENILGMGHYLVHCI